MRRFKFMPTTVGFLTTVLNTVIRSQGLNKDGKYHKN